MYSLLLKEAYYFDNTDLSEFKDKMICILCIFSLFIQQIPLKQLQQFHTGEKLVLIVPKEAKPAVLIHPCKTDFSP